MTRDVEKLCSSIYMHEEKNQNITYLRPFSARVVYKSIEMSENKGGFSENDENSRKKTMWIFQRGWICIEKNRTIQLIYIFVSFRIENEIVIKIYNNYRHIKQNNQPANQSIHQSNGSTNTRANSNP